MTDAAVPRWGGAPARVTTDATPQDSVFDATLDVIERDGVAGVTFQTVARVAGVPAPRVADEFSTVNDLLEHTLMWIDHQTAEVLADCEQETDSIAAFARWFVSDFPAERGRVIAEYELFLFAARHPSMLPTARRWLTDLSALVDTWTNSRRATRTICAYIDGILFQSLVSGERPEAATIEKTIRSLV